jgi:hypothetical protein
VVVICGGLAVECWASVVNGRHFSEVEKHATFLKYFCGKVFSARVGCRFEFWQPEGMDRRPIFRLDRVYSLPPWVEWVGFRRLGLKGLKSWGECNPSGSFDCDAQRRASPLRMTLW